LFIKENLDVEDGEYTKRRTIEHICNFIGVALIVLNHQIKLFNIESPFDVSFLL
jgi:hypothetical protein